MSALAGDYPYVGWTLPYRDPAAGKAVLASHSEPFDLLLGRRTYDIWSRFWPKAPNSPLADSLNAATKYVATTGRTVFNGVRSRVLDRTSLRAFAESRRSTGPA
jgi:dihydrofolate reductase